MLKITFEGFEETLGSSSRRYATRYEPNSRDACLSWWESGSHSSTEPRSDYKSTDLGATVDSEARRQFALLLDISHTGASIALDRVPRSGEGVWFRVEGESQSDWTEAEVVGVTTTTRGPHLVRLAFRAPCPFETLKAAVCG